jgi:hypothetical protein
MPHTPGPWHINGDCWVGFDRNNAEAGGYQFCAVAHVTNRVGCLDANARLIAAAPDLLAACERAVSALAANGAPNCEAAKECGAAIARAKGGA